MQGGFPLQRRKLKLQLRASQIQAPPGRTFWSTPVQLDAVGGAAVVSVPCPLQGPPSSAVDHRAAYMVAVTAAQVSCLRPLFSLRQPHDSSNPPSMKKHPQQTSWLSEPCHVLALHCV